MHHQGLYCNSNEILITHGAQQAISLINQLLIKKKEILLIEDLTYPGFIQNTNFYSPQYIILRSEDSGFIDISYLEDMLKIYKTPLLYIIPNGHNPKAYSLNDNIKLQLAYLSEKYKFYIIEDDPYRFISYVTYNVSPFRSITSNSIYIGSFSKIISPALRVGWIIADAGIVTQLEYLKDMHDLNISNVGQIIINKVLENENIINIVKPQIKEYEKRKNTMIESIKENFSFPYELIIPEHGMFLFVLIYNVNLEKKIHKIIQQSGVIYIPGNAFAASNNTDNVNFMRLNFTHSTPEKIKIGIQKLSEILLDILNKK